MHLLTMHNNHNYAILTAFSVHGRGYVIPENAGIVYRQHLQPADAGKIHTPHTHLWWQNIIREW